MLYCCILYHISGEGSCAAGTMMPSHGLLSGNFGEGRRSGRGQVQLHNVQVSSLGEEAVRVLLPLVEGLVEVVVAAPPHAVPYS